MKKIYMAMAALMVAGTGFAQTESSRPTSDSANNRVDTIRAGNFIIIKKSRDNGTARSSTNVSIERKPYTPSKLSTNWWIFDLGFANVDDKTNYAGSEAQGFLR